MNSSNSPLFVKHASHFLETTQRVKVITVICTIAGKFSTGITKQGWGGDITGN